MTDIDLVLNMLAEVTTTSISKQEEPETFDASVKVAKRGGKIAKNTRTEYEKEVGVKAISSANANNKNLLETKPKK